jgi:hypothetical protein
VVGVGFALYRDQEGGVPVWSEIQNVLSDEQGRYSASLGATQPGGLDAGLFASNEPRWLGVQAQIAGEGEQPRILLVSVPYALKAADADTIGGKPVSAFVLAETPTDTSASVSNRAKSAGATALAISGTGTVNTVPKWLDTTGTLGDSAISESNGNVGIGTTSPVGTLSVSKTGGANYIALSAYQEDIYDKGFLVRSARGTPGSTTAVQNGNTLFNLYAQGHDGTDYSVAGGVSVAVDGAVSAGKVPGAVFFSTADSTGTFSERMRITSAGNVGIGTKSPGARLVVEGSDNTVTGIESVVVNDALSGNALASLVTTSAGITTQLVSDGFGTSTFGTPGGYVGTFLAHPFGLFTANSERVRITPTGNVGIGTSSPAAKLEVNGGVRLNTGGARPACDATTRGTLWFAQGGSGVQDSVTVCAKDASDSYAWRTIY